MEKQFDVFKIYQVKEKNGVFTVNVKSDSMLSGSTLNALIKRGFKVIDKGMITGIAPEK